MHDPAISKNLAEAEVVYWLKRSLVKDGLQGRRVHELIVDADASYLGSRFRAQLEPTGSIWISGWRPDLICLTDENQAERVIAFEVKANTDHEKGVVQASRYRNGAHEAYLCIPATGLAVPDWMLELALLSGIGILRAAPHQIEVELAPKPVQPDPSIVMATQRYLYQGSVRDSVEI
jgi:hypothetical protein